MYYNNCSTNTRIQLPNDTTNKLDRQYASTMATRNPTQEIQGESVMLKIAGNVITASVTYGT